MSGIKGHALRADGAAFTPEGERIEQGTAAGEGVALCECGEVSPTLPSRSKRVLWHRDHKAHQPEEGTVTVPFTGAAKKFWKVLGRDGSVILLGDHRDVTIKEISGANQTVTLEGPPESVKAAARYLVDAWEDAGQAFSTWKRVDAMYQAIGPMRKDTAEQRRGRVTMEREFFTSYVLDYDEIYRTHEATV